MADWRPMVCRVADWFAHLNNKMGGDMKKIQVGGCAGGVGGGVFVRVCVGGWVGWASVQVGAGGGGERARTGPGREVGMASFCLLAAVACLDLG